MTKKINFRCPECGCTTLEEFIEGYRYNSVESMKKQQDGDYVYVTVKSSFLDYCWDEDPQGFRCHDCNYWVGTTERQAYTWLEEHGMLDEQMDEKVNSS